VARRTTGTRATTGAADATLTTVKAGAHPGAAGTALATAAALAAHAAVTGSSE
jgi:hypothetical protein